MTGVTAGQYGEICDVVERTYQRLPLNRGSNDPAYTSAEARAAATRIVEILGLGYADPREAARPAAMRSGFPVARTAHVEYAFHKRQGARSNGDYHAVLDQPLTSGHLYRAAGDALCKPRDKFWGLEVGNPDALVNCGRCAVLMGRHGVTVVRRTA